MTMSLFIIFCFVKIVTGFVSIDFRFCNVQNTSAKFMIEVLQTNFPYIALIEIPSWATAALNGCDCARRGLNAVPTLAVPQKTEYLDLSGNNLRKLSPKDFLNLTNLVAINLEKNCLKLRLPSETAPFCKSELYIESGTFENLQKLRLLLLTANFLKEFPSKIPSSLQYLTIDDTLLGNITASLTRYGSNIKGIAGRNNCNTDPKALFINTNCPRKFTISSNFSNKLEILILTLNNWTKIPTYLMHNNLKLFDLSFNHVTLLRKNDFINGTNLKVLILTAVAHASQPTLEKGLFDPLTKLEVLVLRVNAIKHLFPDIFRNNSKLKMLDLSYNDLFQTIYNPTYLNNLGSLWYLDISANVLSGNGSFCKNELILGPTFSNLTSLHTLFVGFPSSKSFYYPFQASSVQFVSINEQTMDLLASMKQLRVLSFSGLSLKWLNSSALRKLKNLHSFDASNNNIRFQSATNKDSSQNLFVEPFFEGCNFVSSKNVDSYHFTKLNDIMYNTKLLKLVLDFHRSNDCTATNVLTLSNNIIESLKDNLKFMHQACMIDLSNNRIHYIYNSDFNDYNNLQILILSYNPLHFIETYALSSLMNIRVLKLNEVQLSDKTKKTLRFLHHIPNATSLSLTWSDQELVVSLVCNILHVPFKFVHDINLSKNYIYYDVSITTFLFGNAVSLELRDCQIIDAMLQKPLLPSTNNLENLDVGNNGLTELPTKAIQNLRLLKQINLNHNNICRLSGTFLCNLTYLIAFDISHNRISYIQPGFFSYSKLLKIDLSHNQIARLGNDILTREVLIGLAYLNFLGNEIDCSCGVWDTFYVWSVSPESQQVVIPGYIPKCSTDLHEICLACRSPFYLKGVSLLWFASHPTCQVFSLSTYTITFTSLFILFILTGSLGYSQWIKRVIFRRVNQQFRVHSMDRELEQVQSDAGQQGSVFVVFDFHDHEVADWVDYKLCHALTNSKPPIALKVLGRDNPGGIASSKQALHNICNCRKTILILSYDFCLEKSCRFIVSALEELRYSKGDDHLVLVAWSGEKGAPCVPRDIQQTLNRKKQTFLRFDATDDDEEMFFETLKTALFNPAEIASCFFK